MIIFIMFPIRNDDDCQNGKIETALSLIHKTRSRM